MSINLQQFNHRFEELNSIGDSETLVYIHNCFLKYFKESLPYVYPFFGDTSGIFCEWDIKNEKHNWDASLDVNLETQQGYFHAINFNDKKEIECDLDLKQQKSWEQLQAQINQLISES